MNDEKLTRAEEIDNIGKIIQRNLATRVVGFDDPNFLALAIRDEENVRVNEKSVRLGFRSFKDLLESKEMSKFVEVIERNGNDKTTYKARKDETTRLVIEQQQRFAVERMRRERMRQQHNQLPTAAAKIQSNRLSFLHFKTIEPQLSIERKRSEYKWDIDLKTSSDDKLRTSIDHRRPLPKMSASALLALALFGFAIGNKQEEQQQQQATKTPILPFNMELADSNGDGKVSLAELKEFLDSEPFAHRFKGPLFEANGGELPIEQLKATSPTEAAKFVEEADKAPENGKLDFAEWKRFICLMGEKMLDADKDGFISKQEMEGTR
uniref:EF-hand domain-containing protein n=2 Tax=Globodera pallida TaxID=36090 RepID=A0A183BIL3_GLOPA